MAENSTRAVDLRRHILDTTRHLLVRDGYQELSMRRIARAIGYSATSIYIHFDSRDALFHALVEEGMDLLHERLEVVAASHLDDPVTRLEALCRAYVNFGLENQEYYEIMFMLHPELSVPFPAEKYRRARRNLVVIASTLEEGRTLGLLRTDDPFLAATVIWAQLHGTVSLRLANRIDGSIATEAYVDAAIEHTLSSYRMNAENQHGPA